MRSPREIQALLPYRPFRCFTALLLALSLAWPTGAKSQPEQALSVLADASLRLPLTRFARDYSREHNTPVTLWFASAADMNAAIRDGADADMIITPDEETLRSLREAGQTDVYATRPIASTPLVLASFKGGPSLAQLSADSSSPLTLVIPPRQRPLEGRMTAQAIAESDLINRRQDKELIEAPTPEAAAERMESLRAPALMLAVEMFSTPGLELLVRFPDRIVPPATYHAAALAGGQLDASRVFIKALSSTAARRIFAEYGMAETVP